VYTNAFGRNFFADMLDIFVDLVHMIFRAKPSGYTNKYGESVVADIEDMGTTFVHLFVHNIALFLAVAVIGFAWQPLIVPAAQNLGNLLNPAPQAVVNPPEAIVPSQTSTSMPPTVTPTPTPTLTPTPSPMPTVTAFSYSFGSSIKAETLQTIMEHLSMQPEDFVVNLTENIGHPIVAAYGEVVSYELSGNGLYVLFATTGGIFKAKIDYFIVPTHHWPAPFLAINKLTYDQVIMIRDYLNQTIEELNRSPVRLYGVWIGIVGIATESDTEKCENDLASLDNWKELCFYNSSLSAITSQEMEEMIRGAIVPTAVLDVNSPLPLLSFEGKNVKAYTYMEGP